MLIHNIALSLSTTCLSVGLPIKFLLDEGSRSCVQPVGQAIKTVLCFIPPSPADWMSREKPSRRLDVTTTWEKPFVRSAAMAAFRFCRTHQPMGGNRVVSGAANEVRMSLKELLKNPSSLWTSQLHLYSTSHDQCNLKLKPITIGAGRKGVESGHSFHTPLFISE